MAIEKEESKPQQSAIEYCEETYPQTCEEFNVQYVEYPRLRLAIASHVAYLKQMGRD